MLEYDIPENSLWELVVAAEHKAIQDACVIWHWRTCSSPGTLDGGPAPLRASLMGDQLLSLSTLDREPAPLSVHPGPIAKSFPPNQSALLVEQSCALFM